MNHLIFVFFSVVFDFGDVIFCLGLDPDEAIFDLCEYFFFLDDPALEFADEFPYSAVPGLVDDVHGLEAVSLMLAEHLALAAGRLAAVLAVVVQADSMLWAFLELLAALEDQRDDARELVDETAAVGQLPLQSLPTVGTLRFEFQTCTYAALAVDFGTERAESRLLGPAVADLAGEQLLELLLGLLQPRGGLIIGRPFKHQSHYRQYNRGQTMMMVAGQCLAVLHLSPSMRRRRRAGKQPIFCSNLISTYSPMEKRTLTISPFLRQKQSPLTEQASSSISAWRCTTVSWAWKSTPLMQNALFLPTSSFFSFLRIFSSLGYHITLSEAFDFMLKLSMCVWFSDSDL